MKISTKGRYALRLMLNLAIDNSKKHISLKSISEKEEISVKYLEQIVNILNHAGLVKSVRGSMGGYCLSKKPEQYTVGMILRVIEGSLAPVVCLETEINECSRKDKCVTLVVWKKLERAINEVVDNITLKDLVDIYNQF